MKMKFMSSCHLLNESVGGDKVTLGGDFFTRTKKLSQQKVLKI